ncbi:hypothetical protein ACW9HV_04035 [Pseudomonas azotoformans]
MASRRPGVPAYRRTGVPAYRRRARGLRPALRAESRPSGLIPDASGP